MPPPPTPIWATAGEHAPMPLESIPVALEPSSDSSCDDNAVPIEAIQICVHSVPYLGSSIVATKTTIESEEKLEEIYLLQSLSFMDDNSLYKLSTLSWRMAGTHVYIVDPDNCTMILLIIYCTRAYTRDSKSIGSRVQSQ